MHKIGNGLSHLAAAVAIITVASLPWMLGGVVPVARAVLLVGAVTAGLLSLLSNLLLRRHPHSLPLVAVPLTALTLLGIWQLRPAPSQLECIDHAVSISSDVLTLPETSAASLSPPDTRSSIGTLMAASILSFVCFDQIQGLRTIACGVFLLALNGVSIIGVGLAQQLKSTVFPLNDVWSFGPAGSFATFVNPNGAAGWLCLCFGIACGWLVFHMKAAPVDTKGQLGARQTHRGRRFMQPVFQFFADLDVWKLMPFLAVALLAVGIATTRSRGGILALVVSVTATLAIRSSRRRLPAALLMLAVCGGSVYGLLWWLDLDQGVITEMETLSDVNEEAGGRATYWLSSLGAVEDFPYAGTGLGSYRFATLPYQTGYSERWYRNADNQYVEMLVEGGFVGFTLFVAVGLTGLITGMAAWRQNQRMMSANDRFAAGGSRRLCGGLGMAVVLATLSQAISAFFDFGVGLPASIALFTVVVAASAGVLSQGARTSSVRSTGAIRCGSKVVLTMQICVLCGGAALIRDQVAAADIDRSVVAGNRLLTPPTTPQQLDQLHDEQVLLEVRLVNRPDDPEGLRMLSRLVTADFRWQVMLADGSQLVRQQAGFDTAFQNFTMFALAVVARQEHPAKDRINSQLLPMLDASGLPVILERLQQQFPLMPNIALARAQVSVLLSDDTMFARQAALAWFVEPANAESLCQLGSLALRMGQAELARELWEHSIQVSIEFQTAILLDAQLNWSRTEAMRLFGPNSYVKCVRVAQMRRDRMLTEALFDLAENLWAQQLSHRTDEGDLLRAMHLKATGRSEDAILWLQDCVLLPGARIPHRRFLAGLLENAGQYMSAIQEWHAIRSLESGDQEADAAIERLRRME